MFIDAMGLILADNASSQLGELAKPRALAAIPFAGRYRIIDFTLSSLVNSGVISVGVLASHKYKSLMDHLGNGAAWDLSRKNKGLYILPPYVNAESYSSTPDIDGFSGLLDFFRMNTAKYVIVAGSNVVFNSTFNDMVNSHDECGADVSVMFSRDMSQFSNGSVVLDTDRNFWVKGLYNSPGRNISDKISMNIFVISRELLIDLITMSVARGDKELTMESLLIRGDKLRIHGYEFVGRHLRIDTIQNYFTASMDLLNSDVRLELFRNDRRIYTKVKDEAPSLYLENSKTENSLISDGCRIAGSVTDSVLFRSVNVSENSRIKNCILMQNVHVSEGCELENVIIDKNSVIKPGVRLVGHHNFPVMIAKNSVV